MVINEEFGSIHGVKIFNYFIGTMLNRKTGMPFSVGFDHTKIVNSKFFRAFWHTHPNMSASPSNIDIITMSQWAIQEGKIFPCLIKGHDGLFNWIIDEDKIAKRSFVIKIGPFFIGGLQ